MKSKRVSVFLLCLAMAMGLFSTIAFAAEYTDADEIGQVYRQAVDEMTARGVLEGYPDGSFHSEDHLSREQGAKIIAYLCLSASAAEELRCEGVPFDDVTVARWSAPYIAWCAEHGIIHGYGNGKFGPSDVLTGDQYAKMLLCALGLAHAADYTYTGAKWYKAVREDAAAANLYHGNPSMETSQPITRGQAALLSWNTIAAAEAKKPSPSNPGGVAPSTPPSSNGGNDIETPEIGIESDPTPPPTETPIDVGEPGGGSDDNGDILLPEVP